MTKKQTPDILGNLLSGADTTPPDTPRAATVPTHGHTRPLGVGLSEGEIEALQAIADGLDISRHAVARFAIYYFLGDYLSGGPAVAALASSIEVPEVKRPARRLRLP